MDNEGQYYLDFVIFYDCLSCKRHLNVPRLFMLC